MEINNLSLDYGSLLLDWKKTIDGGKVAGYKIQRRESKETVWVVIAMAMETEIELENQERGKEWEYRVIGANKTGDGPPSNTVVAVL